MSQIPRRVYSPALEAELKRIAESEDIFMKGKPRAINVIGEVFGRLTVVRPVGHGSNGRLKVLVHCDCGDAKILLYDGLKGGTKSCGCLQVEKRYGKGAMQIQRAFKRMIRTGEIGGAFKPAQADNAHENGECDD